MNTFFLINVCMHDFILFCLYPLISGIHQCFLSYALLFGKKELFTQSTVLLHATLTGSFSLSIIINDHQG